MKAFLCILSLFFFTGSLYSTTPPCSEHLGEIKTIRGVAYDSFIEAHQLTGDVIRSYVVTVEDLAWDAVKYHATYTDFSNTF